jgi:DUF3048 family protein
MRRLLVGLLGVFALASMFGVGLINAGLLGSSPTPGLVGFQSAAPSVAAPSAGATPTPTPSPIPTPTREPLPTPAPTPQLVPAPLTGVMVPPSVAARHPIAVMIDDHGDARPQSGFNSASVVWQAPAEGGIPRYMMVFAEDLPSSVGPVRSARQYYIAWAAEWRAMYVHVGGSPQARATLRQDGQGELVYDADEFRWGSRYLWRISERFAPHNVYSDGQHLRQLARRVGAADGLLQSAWTFGRETEYGLRPRDAVIEVSYQTSKITYRYDFRTNAYRRSVTGEKRQVDAATGAQVAPRNVVVMVMRFGALNDGTSKHRLEAQYLGSGTAWISSNGRTIKGTWKKGRIDRPTRFFDARGRPVVLAPGQTFVQVMPVGSPIKIIQGKRPVLRMDPEGVL